MSQRNPMNPRSQARQKHGDGIKGAARKSAGSAKPARPAGDSVYVTSNKTKKAKAGAPKGAANKQELEKRRERAMGSMVYDMPEYKKWKRVWWACLIVAIVAVAGSFLVNWLNNNGNLPEPLVGIREQFGIVLLVIGYGALIIGLIVDFTKMRKLRKEQEAKARTLSKSERRKLDAAIEESQVQRDKKRAERKSRGLFGRKGAGAADTGETKE